MKATTLYQIIKAYAPSVVEKTICELQRNCSKCNCLQCTILIDFDKIKEKYCKGRSNTMSSSDGVKFSANDSAVFYFIEIKSIKDVIINPKTKKITDGNTVNKQSAKFIKKIDLKLPDSIEICRKIVGNQSLFTDTPKPALVFVTDIDTKQQPLDLFAMNMKRLSEPQLYYEILFNKNIVEGLDAIKKKRKIDVFYTDCNKFDIEYNSDFQNSLI